jgi:hypothetical protein
MRQNNPVLAMLAVSMSVAGSAWAQQPRGPQDPNQSSAASPATSEHVAEMFRARLEALRPEAPLGYLLLAEEVDDSATTSDGRRLALELYVRAIAYGVRNGADLSSAQSAASALTEYGRKPAEKTWLRVFAEHLRGEESGGATTSGEDLLGSEAIDAQVAACIGFVRSGDGVFARQLLRKPEVADRLQAINSRIVRWGYDPGAQGLVREAARWPCGECGNVGVIRRPSGWRVCPECAGTPGPKLSDTADRALLRVQLWLLRGAGASWSAQVAIDGGEPYLEQAMEDPAELFGVDVAKGRWVDGAWVTEVAPAAAPESESPVTPPAPGDGG